ncbi:50S ribosomal protein L10 [Candidatus Pacearchaeota archaeon]|nr:50S ribosomal protein L10 [Candidatus Pacearchaeota archaeon]
MATVKAHVSKEKLKIVKELVELIESNNTIMLASIKGLPLKQFQKIKKQLSEEVVIKVLKKRMLKKSLESSKKPGIQDLSKFIKEDCAVLISDIDAFDLSLKLNQSKSPVKAKAGQVSPIDIEVEAGQTDLPAGPAVSELGGLGITVKVTQGKIEIVSPRVIVKEGQKISEGAASVMSKLNILPFSVGFTPLVAYDSKSGQVYKEIKVDKEEATEILQESARKALAFAVSIAFTTKDTLKFLLAKAISHEKAISKLINKENKGESKNE